MEKQHRRPYRITLLLLLLGAVSFLSFPNLGAFRLLLLSDETTKTTELKTSLSNNNNKNRIESILPAHCFRDLLDPNQAHAFVTQHTNVSLVSLLQGLVSLAKATSTRLLTLQIQHEESTQLHSLLEEKHWFPIVLQQQQQQSSSRNDTLRNRAQYNCAYAQEYLVTYEQQEESTCPFYTFRDTAFCRRQQQQRRRRLQAWNQSTLEFVHKCVVETEIPCGPIPLKTEPTILLLPDATFVSHLLQQWKSPLMRIAEMNATTIAILQQHHYRVYKDDTAWMALYWGPKYADTTGLSENLHLVESMDTTASVSLLEDAPTSAALDKKDLTNECFSDFLPTDVVRRRLVVSLVGYNETKPPPFPMLGRALLDLALNASQRLLTLQIGGMDGKSNDPLYEMFVSKYGRDLGWDIRPWFPLVVEPVHTNFANLMQTYREIAQTKNVSCFHAQQYAISYDDANNDSICPFYRFRDNDDPNNTEYCRSRPDWMRLQVGTLSSGQHKLIFGPKVYEECIIADPVPCGSVRSLWKSLHDGTDQQPPFAMIQIDTEGYEEHIIPGILQEWKQAGWSLPPLIHFEDKCLKAFDKRDSTQRWPQLQQVLRDHNYLIFADGEDSTAVWMGTPDAFPLESSQKTQTELPKPVPEECFASFLDQDQIRSRIQTAAVGYNQTRPPSFPMLGRTLLDLARNASKRLLTLQIGGMDGKSNDPLYGMFVASYGHDLGLDIRHWFPIVVEPVHYNFANLTQTYLEIARNKNVSCFHAQQYAVSYDDAKEDNLCPFYRFRDNDDPNSTEYCRSRPDWMRLQVGTLFSGQHKWIFGPQVFDECVIADPVPCGSVRNLWNSLHKVDDQPPFAVIQIDTEGYEEHIIPGLLREWKEAGWSLPPLIHFEDKCLKDFDRRNQTERWPHLQQVLWDHGYTLFPDGEDSTALLL